MDIPPNAELIRQFTAPDGVERLTWRIDAPNKITARGIARTASRAARPGAKNIFNPETVSREEAEQATIRDFFPKSFQKETWEIKVVVVR